MTTCQGEKRNKYQGISLIRDYSYHDYSCSESEHTGIGSTKGILKCLISSLLSGCCAIDRLYFGPTMRVVENRSIGKELPEDAGYLWGIPGRCAAGRCQRAGVAGI